MSLSISLKLILFCACCFYPLVSDAVSATTLLDETDSLLSQKSKQYTFISPGTNDIDFLFQHEKYSYTIPWTIDLIDSGKKRLLRFKSPGDRPITHKVLNVPAGKYTIIVSASNKAVKDAEYRITVKTKLDTPAVFEPQADRKQPTQEINDKTIPLGEAPLPALPADNSTTDSGILHLNIPVSDSVGIKRKKVYFFNIAQAGVQKIRFTHRQYTHNLPWLITLRDQAGEALLHARSTGKDSEIERLIALEKGNFSLEVRCSNTSLSNEQYTIIIETDPEVHFEIEPNNTVEAATPILTDNLYLAVLQTLPVGQDRDYFTFSLPEDGNIVIKFLHDSIASDMSWSYSLSSKTERLFSQTSMAREELSSEQKMLTAGTYLLDVSSSSGALNDYPYKIGAYFEPKEMYFFRVANEKNSIESFSQYLDVYPGGKFGEDAKNNIEALVFQKAEEEGSIELYKDYLQKYMNGRFTPQAKEMVAYLETKIKDNVESFEIFLLDFPNTKFKNEVLSTVEKFLYEKAVHENSIAGYNTFLDRFPAGAFSIKALSQKEELIYRRALNDYTLASIEAYLKEFPDGVFVKELEQEKEHLHMFEEILSRGSLEGYERYLTTYPSGKYFQRISHKREEKLWEESMKTNSIEGFAFYMNEYPEGKYIEKAKQEREKHFWRETENNGTISAFEHYLQEYPSGRNSAQAKTRREELLWEDTRKKNTISGYDVYLKEYPSGKFSLDAKQEKEELFWERAQNSDTVADSDRYIEEYPSGKYLKKVTQRREDLAWKDAQKSDTLVAFDTYLKDYPSGKYTRNVHKRREILYFEEATAQKSVTGYLAYLQHYPSGKYVDEILVDLEAPLYAEVKGKGDVTKYDQYLTLFPDGRYTDAISMERIYYLFENKFKEASNSSYTYDFSSFKELMEKTVDEDNIDYVSKSIENLEMYNCQAACVSQVFGIEQGSSAGNVAALDSEQAVRLYSAWNPCGRIKYTQFIAQAAALTETPRCSKGEGEYWVEVDESPSSSGWENGGSSKGFEILQKSNASIQVEKTREGKNVHVSVHGVQSGNSLFIAMQGSGYNDEKVCEGKDECYLPGINEFPVDIVVSFKGYCGTFSGCYNQQTSTLIRIIETGNWLVNVHPD